jgi:hypothetical protein
MSDDIKQRCGSCGLSIADSETGIRHYGMSISHSEGRCISLLRAEIERLEARVAKLIRDCAEADGRIAEIATERDAARAEAAALRLMSEDLMRDLDALRKDAELLDFVDDSTIGTIQSKTYPLADTGDYDVSWTVREYKTDKFLGCGGNIRAAIDAAREGGK